MISKSIRRLASIPLLVLLLTLSVRVTDGVAGDFTLDSKARIEVIERVSMVLNESYVFPDLAKRMEDTIRNRLRTKKYDDITSAIAFAQVLTADLREVSRDKHIVIEAITSPVPQLSTIVETDEDRERSRELKRKEGILINFGFTKLERLRGNVGYMNMSIFWSAEHGGEMATTAMSFLRNTDALIIDLRDNDGGSPDMVALLTSYFFDGSPVQLTGIHWRKGDRIDESWTLPYIPGTKYLHKSVYILTSNQGTVSAAEAFVYNLKILKRATIVGEITAGAANPGAMVRVNERFSMFVPTGRAYNPKTKGNWEGVGIAPDIEVSAANALKSAYLEALNKLKDATGDQARKAYFSEVIEAIKKQP